MSFRVATRLPVIHTYFPTKLFRVNVDGPNVALQPWKFASALYDIRVDENGMVFPKTRAIEAGRYIGPNGAVMRPNTPMLHAVLTKHWMYKKKDAVIYEIEKGTELAEGLILVHERSDVFSLQPDAPMQLSELNKLLTDFLQSNGKSYTKQEFLEAYPRPIKVEGAHIVRSIINPGHNNHAAKLSVEHPKTRWRGDFEGRYAFGGFKGPKF
ncbi:hypothetical protein VTI28DRAFT_4504 [Corynascus sepedonium]